MGALPILGALPLSILMGEKPEMKKFSAAIMMAGAMLLGACAAQEVDKDAVKKQVAEELSKATAQEAEAEEPTTTEAPTTTRPPTTTTTIDVSWAIDVAITNDQIVGYMERTSEAAGNYDMDAIMSICQEARGHAGQWLSVARSITLPDVRRPYLAAINEFNEAFAACSYGDLDSSGGHMQAGSDLVVEATNALSSHNLNTD